MFHVPCYAFLESCNISYVLGPLQLSLSTQHLSLATTIATLANYMQYICKTGTWLR